MRFLLGAAIAVALVGGASAAPSQPAICRTLKSAWVGFGEKGTRDEAETRLDQEIATWKERYSLASLKPKNRKTACSIYIEFLNEYECTAEAVVCR
jgi:hypothetical protein